MHKHNAFSLVEMVVVITILLIILSISIIGVRSMQISARDNERKADIETIAMNLETMYAKELRRTATNAVVKPQGSYPPVEGTYSTALTLLPEMTSSLEAGSVTAPEQAKTVQSLQAPYKDVCNTSTSTATTCFLNPTTMNTRLAPPNITKNDYIYVPFVDETVTPQVLCTLSQVQLGKSCRSFKLYYVLESSSSVTQTMGSKRK